MDAIYIPTENDFKKWIKEALTEHLSIELSKHFQHAGEPESLISKKEMASTLKITLVTLNEWIKKGLPSHKQGRRVYFLKSEVFSYLKDQRGFYTK